MKQGVRLLIGVGLMAAAGSCAGRNLPPEPDSYVAADAIGAERAAELAASPAATWLDDMNSPEMSALAREALAGSPDLQIVEARYRAARWRARGTFGGNLLPSVSAGLDRSREQAPDLINGGRTHPEDRYSSSVIASWEIDLWGRLTASALASDLSADALERDLDGARLSVAGQTASGWVDLIEAQRDAFFGREVDARRDAIVELHHQHGGQRDDIDVLQPVRSSNSPQRVLDHADGVTGLCAAIGAGIPVIHARHRERDHFARKIGFSPSAAGTAVLGGRFSAALLGCAPLFRHSPPRRNKSSTLAPPTRVATTTPPASRRWPRARSVVPSPLPGRCATRSSHPPPPHSG